MLRVGLNDRSTGLWLLSAAALWSGLCATLQLSGHTPSRPGLLPHWYGVQAVLVWVLLPVQGEVVRRVAAKVAAVSTAQASSAVRGFAAALWFFLLSDIIAMRVVGFSGLGGVLRFTGPMALCVGIWVGAVGLGKAGSSRARSILAMGLAILAAGVVGAPFLR